MADKYFYKKSPNDNFCNSEEFRDLRDEIADWLTLDGIDEFYGFMREGLSGQIGTQLAREQDVDEASFDKMEQFFADTLEKVRLKYRPYMSEDLTDEEEDDCLEGLNEELQALASDFANVIIGLREKSMPIDKADIDKALATTINARLSVKQVFDKDAKSAVVPDGREFVYFRYEIQQHIMLRNFTDYLEFVDGKLADGLARSIAYSYVKVQKDRELLEDAFSFMLDDVRTIHKDLYDKLYWRRLPHELTSEQEARLLAKINIELYELAPDMANMIIGVREAATPIQVRHLKLNI